MDSQDSSKGEHYNLRWNNYSSNLIQVFSEHQHHERLVDVTLTCEGQYIKAHKLILSACSGFFQEMFRMHSSVQHPIIILNGIKFNHLQHIIEFIYQGEIKVLDADLEGVLTLGESFQVKGLSSVKLKHSSQQTHPTQILPTILPRIPATNVPPHQIQDTSFLQNQIQDVQQAHTTDLLNNLPQSTNLLQNQIQSTDTLQSQAINLSQNSKTENSLTNILSLQNISNSLDSQKHARRVQVITNKAEAEHFKSVHSDFVKFNHDSSEYPPLKRIRTAASPNKLPGLTSTDSVESSKTKENVDDSEKIARPPNAFMIFANEWRRKLQVEHPEENNKEISVRLGNMWKALSIQTKDTYYAAAKKAQEEHVIKHPGYIFNAKRKATRNMDSTQLTSVENQDFDDDLQIIEAADNLVDISHSPEPPNT